MARRNTTAAPAAPAKPRRTRAAKPTTPEPPVVADTTQVEAERVAERCAAGQAAVPAVTKWLGVLGTALEAVDDDSARAAADELLAAVTAVRAALKVRKQRPPRLRSPKDPALCAWHAVHPDGTIEAASLLRASTARDIAVGKKHVRDLGDQATERDRRLAECSLVRNEAVDEVAPA